jgi:phosphoribosylanthranilate isomerase
MPDLNTKVKKVGVFINAAEEYIFSIAQRYQLDLIQLQGNEDPDFCKKISERYPVIKAFGVNKDFDLKELDPFKNYCRFFLFDNKTENFGGIAEPFNWDILKSYDNSVPYFIAAGMDHERLKILKNLEVKPYGIDVTNRWEIKPGYKDIIRLIRFKNDIKHF